MKRWSGGGWSRAAASLSAAALAACVWTGACARRPEPAELEIRNLVEEALSAIKRGDCGRLQELFASDPRYEGNEPGQDPSAPAERLRLRDFCQTPEFDYDAPSPEIAVLGGRAAVTFDLTYRFRLREETAERQMHVTLFLERGPQGWRILRDAIAFPSEPNPDVVGRRPDPAPVPSGRAQ